MLLKLKHYFLRLEARNAMIDRNNNRKICCQFYWQIFQSFRTAEQSRDIRKHQKHNTLCPCMRTRDTNWGFWELQQWGQEAQIAASKGKMGVLDDFGSWAHTCRGPTLTHPPAGPRSWCKSEQNELISSSAPFFFTSIRFVFFSSIFINHFTMCGNFIPVANHFNFLSTKLSKMIHFSAKSASPLYIMSTLQPFMQSQILRQSQIGNSKHCTI